MNEVKRILMAGDGWVSWGLIGETEDQKIKGDDPRYFLMKLTNYVDTVDQ